MKKILIALLLIVTMTLGTACSDRNGGASDETEKSNKRTVSTKVDLSTPENTITSFIKAFTALDVDAINKTLSTSEYAKNYDIYAMADRLQAWNPLQMGMVQGDPLFEQINFYQKGNRQMMQLQMMMITLLTDGKLADTDYGMIISGESLTPAMDALKGIDPKDMSQLELVKLAKPTDIIDSDRYKENSLKQAKPFGASDKTERVALLKMGDRYYTAGFEVMQYGDKWLIDSFNSSIAGLAYYGELVVTTPDEFDSEYVEDEE